MKQSNSNIRFTSPIGLNDDGKPWKEEDIPWEFDENGIIILKNDSLNTGDKRNLTAVEDIPEKPNS